MDKVNIEFISKEHEAFYKKHFVPDNPWKQGFFYTVGLSEQCRENVSDLWDQGKGIIKPDGLETAWQTWSSLAITRLAFNLYTGNTYGDPDRYTPRSLFRNLDEDLRRGAVLAIEYFA